MDGDLRMIAVSEKALTNKVNKNHTCLSVCLGVNSGIFSKSTYHHIEHKKLVRTSGKAPPVLADFLCFLFSQKRATMKI